MRILLAEHHNQVLKAMQTLLREKTDYTLVGEAIDTDNLLDQVEKTNPDLVVLAWDLPGRPSADIIATLKTFNPRPTVVVISSQLDLEETALHAGADAFVSKGDPPEKLLVTLHEMQLSVEDQAKKQIDKLDEV